MEPTRGEKVDPWGIGGIEDYGSLIQEFGIKLIEEILPRIPHPNKYMQRHIVFGHTELERILDALDANEPFAVMSGIKPSGPFHMGSKMTAEEIIYFQHLSPKAIAFYCIADYEAYADNRQSLEESYEVAISHLADVLALGLDPKQAYIYRQSQEKRVLERAFIYSRDVTYNMMEAIYGNRPFGLYLSALIQVADILLPETNDFGGPKPVVVPIGAEQAPHIRLTRDIAKRHNEENFVPPSATYHKLIRSLTGSSKMSKREPMGLLSLTDDPEFAQKKILLAYTGGRESIKIQKELGGEPAKCVVYEYLMFHFLEDDKELENIHADCLTGTRLCGPCKMQAAEIVAKYLKNHQQKRIEMLPIAEEILENPHR
ncbi:tryptophan--tRNA ligase [Candidatus Bathyarchaeota archaeon]|nr:tryptophan--tRNA ligase [Candidatus Bathyarchaeota archaeon]